MKLSIGLPDQIISACILLQTLSKNGLKLENCQYIPADNNINNLNQPINLSCKLQFDLVNRNMNTVFSIRKRQVIGFITRLNKGMEQLEVKYKKNMRIIF